MSSFQTDSQDYLYNPEPAAPLRILLQNGKPVDILITHEAEMRPASTKKEREQRDKLAKIAARRQKRKKEQEALSEQIYTNLQTIGTDYRAPNSDYREYTRGWDSRHPFDNNPNTGFQAFVFACAGWDDNPLDSEAQEAANASLEGWRGVRGISCIRLAKVEESGQVTYAFADQKPEPMSFEKRGKGEHPIQSEPVGPYRGVEEALNSLRQEPVTTESLNTAAAAWMLDPVAERACLAAMLGEHLKKTYARQCKAFLKGSELHEPLDLLMEFLSTLLVALDAGKYSHEGKIENWVGTRWKHFRCSFQEQFYEQKETTEYASVVRYSQTGEQIDDDYLSPFDGVSERQQKNPQVSRLAANQRANSLLAGEIECLPADTRMMLKQMSEGLKKSDAAYATGMNERTARRRLSDFKKAFNASKEAA